MRSSGKNWKAEPEEKAILKGMWAVEWGKPAALGTDIARHAWEDQHL